MARKPTDYVQFKLRIRQSLLKQIQKEAAKKKHSANNEAVERLEKSFALETQAMRNSAIIDLVVDREKSDRWRPLLSLLTKYPELFDHRVSAEAGMKSFAEAAMKSFAKEASTTSREERDEESEPGDDK
jgi:hypothetical protein